MDIDIEQRVKNLEQKMAALEGQVQAQPSVRDELDNIEKYEIVHQVLQVFKTQISNEVL